MAHVKITSEKGVARLEVDGVDLSLAALRKGFTVKFDTGDGFEPPEVSMILGADTLEMDLPDAVVVTERDNDYGPQIAQINKKLAALVKATERSGRDIGREINRAASSEKRGRR